jgi:hypothetical protein
MASVELRFTTHHFVSKDIREHKYKNKSQAWVSNPRFSKRPLTAVPSDRVNEKEMTPIPQLPSQPHNLSVINIPDIQSQRSSSEVLRTEAGTKLQGIVDSTVNTFLDVPDIRSRCSSSESTRVQEWNDNQGNVDCVWVNYILKRWLPYPLAHAQPGDPDPGLWAPNVIFPWIVLMADICYWWIFKHKVIFRLPLEGPRVMKHDENRGYLFLR